MEANRTDRENIQANYIRAYRFAWRLMIGLSFAAFIGIQLVLHDINIALVFGGICLIGMMSKELFLVWVFKGPPPSEEEKEVKHPWRGTIAQILFVALVCLVPDISTGQLSPRSFVVALVSGIGLALFLSWQRSHLSLKNKPVQ